jgi:hypothetical protein
MKDFVLFDAHPCGISGAPTTEALDGWACVQNCLSLKELEAALQRSSSGTARIQTDVYPITITKKKRESEISSSQISKKQRSDDKVILGFKNLRSFF